MKPEYDLTREPWIPCLRLDGSPTMLGLGEVLANAHELREISAETPLCTASIYRLLLALLQRVLNPTNIDAWEALWRAGAWPADQIEAYLEAWRARFDLFHSAHPFLQLGDRRVKPKSISALLPEVASGNNPTLFSHQLDKESFSVAPDRAARILLAAHTFGVGGLSGIEQKFTDAPCASGAVFLAEGDSLFETLALNLTQRPWIEGDPLAARDRPAWEVDDPTQPERDLPYGDLDSLTWPNRRILLLPEQENGAWCVRQVTVAPALRQQGGALDAMLHYGIDKKIGPRPLAFDESRALWRDSGVLLSLGGTGYRQARVVEWLGLLVQEGVLSRSQRFRLMALGMAKDRAKVEFYRAEHLPLPLEYLARRELVEVIQEALSLADTVSRGLWGATQTLATHVIVPEADLKDAHEPSKGDTSSLTTQWRVDWRYWATLESPFFTLLDELPSDVEGARKAWRDTLRDAAWNALESVTRWLEESPRYMKAVVLARRRLASALGNALATRGGQEISG